MNALPRKGSDSRVFERIDFTYWPQTGQIEWHGHVDSDGETALLPVPSDQVHTALDALGAELRKRIAAGRWFDERLGCDRVGSPKPHERRAR